MNKIYRLLICMCPFWLPVVQAAQPVSVEIRAEQWDIPRHGEVLLEQRQLSEIIRRWMEQPESKIEIRYPGGEEGELWARELMDWMIALGIPSSVMRRIPGSGAEDVIGLVLMPAVGDSRDPGIP